MLLWVVAQDVRCLALGHVQGAPQVQATCLQQLELHQGRSLAGARGRREGGGPVGGGAGALRNSTQGSCCMAQRIAGRR